MVCPLPQLFWAYQGTYLIYLGVFYILLFIAINDLKVLFQIEQKRFLIYYIKNFIQNMLYVKLFIKLQKNIFQINCQYFPADMEIKIKNNICRTILLFYFIVFLISSQQQINEQISVCLGNCMYCNSSEPEICLDKNYLKYDTILCQPFYRGTNCQQKTFGYQNLIKGNNSFNNWNIIKMTPIQLVQLNSSTNQLVANQNRTYMSLGPINSSQNLYRVIPLPNTMPNNRIVLKLSLGIDDSTLQKYFNQLKSVNSSSSSSQASSTQNITQILPNGTQIITIITTTNTTRSNNGSISSQGVGGWKFMYVQLIDSSNSSSIIERKSLSYSQLSKVRTSSGYVYSFQLKYDLLKQYNQVGIKMYLINPTTDQKGVQWSLLNFEASVGCRGYVVSSFSIGSYSCNSCLSGFYPSYSLASGQVQECRNCDFRCKTCLSQNTCLTCVQNTVFNQLNGLCQYSNYFNTLIGYQLINGKYIEEGQYTYKIIRSQNGIVQVAQPLANFQSYTVYFDMFYTAAFRNSGQILKVLINGQQYSFNSLTLPLTSSTIISGISSTSTNIYQNRLSFNVSGVNQNTWNVNANSNSSSSSSNSFSSSNSSSASNFTSNSTSTNNSSINGSATSNVSNILIICGTANTGGGSLTGQQIGVGNFNVVQFQCSKNCLQCEYNAFTQGSTCIKCNYFFDRNSSCLNCANGYYLTLVSGTKTQQCIKCHSTCKQCSGPQIQHCLDCFDGFRLGSIIYDYSCINCLNKLQQNNNPSFIPACKLAPNCLNDHPLNKVLTNQNCQACFQNKNQSITSSQVCKLCWIQQNLANSFCQPIPQRGYQLYGSDISQGVISSQWTTNKVLARKSLNSFYTDLYGVDYETTSNNQTAVMKFTESFLPNHRGLVIFFTLFKVNTWYQGTGTSGSILGHFINILIRSQNYIIRNQTIQVNNAFGNNIYGGFGSGNQMIYTFLGNYQEHTYTGNTQIIITSSHTGIFVRDLEFYLGNCKQCNGNKMNYQVYYIPMYSTNTTQTGLDVWLTFNQGVNLVSRDLHTQNMILNSFQFSIDQIGYQNLLPFKILQNRVNQWNYVKYFIPLNGSLLNATLRVNNSMGYNIYSKVSKVQAYLSNPLIQHKDRNLMFQYILQQDFTSKSQFTAQTRTRLLLNERLSLTNVQQKVHRYEDIKLDQRKSMQQLDSFYQFFQWFTLFTMIVFAFFGFGVIFQEFSILIQLLFLHIYISTNLLPVTFKKPLSHMQKIQNLNFFAYPHAQSIQSSWFKKVQQRSPYPLTQYNVDIYFARSFYPIIIINLIYLGWFLILFICLKLINKFKYSENRIVKLFRNIPQRPLNYFDSIWRYQFITTMWASFIQFHYFDGLTAQIRLNLALCIASFVIALIWPVFVMVYTYSQHFNINVQHFIYLYNDIFYRKIPSVTEKTRYHVYIAVRFGRYFFYALFIAVFVYQNIIGPAILLAVSLLQIIYIIKLKIYTDKIYLVFKVIQNIGFIILQILLLIIYGFSDDTITKQGFISIGYGVEALYILMIINGIVRFIYLGYKKIRDFVNDRYDYGEKGRLINYDNKNSIAIELPTTERGLI